MGRPLGSVNKPKEITTKEAVPETESLGPLQKELRDDVFIEDGRYRMKNDNEALCKECNHRQDRHHVWREVEKNGVERDVYGVKREVTWIEKFKKFDAPVLPCQHACKCQNYK